LQHLECQFLAYCKPSVLWFVFSSQFSKIKEWT
jgi:hypothetical protein